MKYKVQASDASNTYLTSSPLFSAFLVLLDLSEAPGDKFWQLRVCNSWLDFNHTKQETAIFQRF